MRKADFKEWAENHISHAAAIDAASRCKKIETALHVDLDAEYERDRGKWILTTLNYSMDDERSDKPVPEGFIFKEGACIRLRMTDLRSSAKRYFRFCSENGTT